MEIQIEDLLDKLKSQAEELDNRYKAITDICNDIEKIVAHQHSLKLTHCLLEYFF